MKPNENLLNKPIWQMTGAEFLRLCHTGPSEMPQSAPAKASAQKYVYGLDGIANLFGCSKPTASRIKKSGKIDAAITQIRRKIVVDAELALQLLAPQKKKKKK